MPNEYPGLEIKLNKLVETDLAPLARKWKKDLSREDLGFITLLFHYDPDGGIAYVASTPRNDAVRALIEWLKVEGTAQFPHLRAMFEYIYGATRQPGDKDYSAEFIRITKHK